MDVASIIDPGLTAGDLEPYISAADILIGQTLGSLTGSNSLSPPALYQIERWLAAHFCAMAKPEYRIKEAEAAIRENVQIGGSLGSLLQATTWGQTAAMLDSSGTLANLGKQKASISIAQPAAPWSYIMYRRDGFNYGLFGYW